MGLNFEAHVKQITLKQWQFGTQWLVNPELIQAYGPERAIHADAYVMRLRAYIWGREDSVDRHEFPKTWWDAFKQRWFPKWALTRWPVRLVVVEARRGVIYPELCPGGGKGVRADTIAIYLKGEF